MKKKNTNEIRQHPHNYIEDTQKNSEKADEKNISFVIENWKRNEYS